MTRQGLKEIQRRIVDITFRSCGKHPTKGLYVDTGLMDDKIIGICSNDSQDCAFNAMVSIGKYNNRKVVHTGPAYCTDENKGLVVLLFFLTYQYILFKNKLRTFYLTTITHVPKVFGLMAQYFSNVYPNENAKITPKKEHIDIRDLLINSYVKEIEPEYAAIIKNDFILRRFRLQKDGSIVPFPHTADDVPKHRNRIYNDRCLSMIDYTQGDALIQVSEVGVKTYFKNYGKNITRVLVRG